MRDPIALAIPLLLLFVVLEMAWSYRRNLGLYRVADAVTDLGAGIMSQVFVVVWATVQVGIYVAVYQRAHLVDLPATGSGAWLTWVAAFFGVDFLYYWWHRLSHEKNVLWAAHVVHHQSEDYNLAVALRQAILTSWTALPFYLPLALLGIPPAVYAIVYALSTLYQFWIHTQLVGVIKGPIGFVFNLPAHHRVHHAINPEYLDKNYGATLIVWDRLFGTYADEVAAPVYGITKPLGRFSPLWAQIHYWFELGAMIKQARRPIDKLRALVASPAWRPEGMSVPPSPDLAGRVKYGRDLSPLLTAYVLGQYLLLVVGIFLVLLLRHDAPKLSLALACIAIFVGIEAVAGLVEGRRWAAYAEAGRLAIGVAAIVTWTARA